MSDQDFDLVASAHAEMLHEGFQPDFPADANAQVQQIEEHPVAQSPDGLPDLRGLLWSSIDNDTSRDLDQIEYAERVAGGIRVRIGIADVTAEVELHSPLDQHAQSETTTVYTAVRVFPMLPTPLSTGLTSLVEGEDRVAMVIEYVVAPDGSLSASSIYQAVVNNHAQLAYGDVGAWLEDRGAPPPKVASSPELARQLQLQNEAARALRAQRVKLGALNFDRTEVEPVVRDGQIQDITTSRKNRANDLIEDFMVAANEVMARTLRESGVPTIRRVVKTPERWPRIVELAARYGETLPAQPDSGALNEFLRKRKLADRLHYADVSLAVMKLMGPGEYVMAGPGDESSGHFGLAAPDYTHSTAPNRRFADMVVQRLIKSVMAKREQPYSREELAAIADNCTKKEDAARKVERTMMKRVAALAMAPKIGQSFEGIITGVTPKGTFVRLISPPAEGRVMQGEQGLDVGDHVTVRLIATDPRRGFIDFAR